MLNNVLTDKDETVSYKKAAEISVDRTPKKSWAKWQKMTLLPIFLRWGIVTI